VTNADDYRRRIANALGGYIESESRKSNAQREIDQRAVVRMQRTDARGPAPPREQPLERQVLAAILSAFKSVPWIHLIRRNVGLYFTADGRRVYHGTPGQADIYGFLRDGKHVEIEVKRPGGKLSDDQERWREFCERFGMVYVVARSVGDVREALREHGYEV